MLVVTSYLLHADQKQPDNSKNSTQNKKFPEECKRVHEEELRDCIQALTRDEQKIILSELTPTQRKEYLSRLTFNSYEIFLDNYNEYEWKRLLQKLTEEERSYWPKTIKEQRIELAAIIDETTHGSERYQNAFFVLEILPLVKKAREGLEKRLSDGQPLANKISERFKKYIIEKFKC